MKALYFAGQGSTGIDDGAGGIRHARAAVRLMRLAETAQDGGVRVAALLGLVRLPDSAAHFQFLARIAVPAETETAQAATALQVRDTGPAGPAIARQLYLAGSVKQWSARRTLEGAAQKFGWSRP